MTPTWVSRREIGKKLTSDLTKFKRRPKFPLPYRSILEEPSMRNPRSTDIEQTKEKETNRYKVIRKYCKISVLSSGLLQLGKGFMWASN